MEKGMKEFNTYLAFRSYLEELDKLGSKKPFDCIHLIKLPEEVYNAEAHTIYEAGALICSATPGSIGIVPTHRCCTDKTEVKLLEDNTLEVKCGWNGSKFILELKDFIPKNA